MRVATQVDQLITYSAPCPATLGTFEHLCFVSTLNLVELDMNSFFFCTGLLDMTS